MFDLRYETERHRRELEVKNYAQTYNDIRGKRGSDELEFTYYNFKVRYKRVCEALDELYNMQVDSILIVNALLDSLQHNLDRLESYQKEIEEAEGQKEILGRIVEWSCEDKELYIHLNYDDKLRMAKQKEELGAIDYTDNDEITVDYFNNDEFQEIHDRVFPSTKSWQQDFWTDEDRSSYLEIRVVHPEDDE